MPLNNLRRMAVNKGAASPLILPPFPPLPEDIRMRFPSGSSTYERRTEEWRQQTQKLIDQAINALKLDHENLP